MHTNSSTVSLSSIFGGSTKFKGLSNNNNNNISVNNSSDKINTNTNDDTSEKDDFNNLLFSTERHSFSQLSLNSEYNHSSLSLATTLSILNTGVFPIDNKKNKNTNSSNINNPILQNIKSKSTSFDMVQEEEETKETDNDDAFILHPVKIIQSKLEKQYLPSNINQHSIDLNPTSPCNVSSESSDRIRFLDKYNILGETIGEGASSKVTLVSLKDDPSKLYAMKVFHSNRVLPDSYDAHLKNIILEYSIGSILKQQNLIKTLDLLIDDSTRTSVIILEYAPIDFFDLVAQRKMDKYESACYFKQLCHAVQYLHNLGIAHRDLKLDNCVVTNQGILKLLDFGSAVIFNDHYSNQEKLTITTTNSSSNHIIKCIGIVGSDPYLSPELLDPRYIHYDPRPVDVWALAIMYYSMILSKFPWKAPRESFNSFRLFVEDPDDEEDVSKGPLRLLRALPSESHNVIGKMMDLNPNKRISINDVLKDRWMRSIPECHFDNENNLIHDLEDHTHHLDVDNRNQAHNNHMSNGTNGSNNNNNNKNNTGNTTNNVPSFQNEKESSYNYTRYISGRKLSL